MSRISDFKQIAKNFGASPRALASIISEAESLEPLVIEDDRPYHRFVVVDVVPERSLFFRKELLAYSVDDDEMLLPVTVKNMYKTTEAAHDVCDLLQKMFVGKTRKECERLLGVD